MITLRFIPFFFLLLLIQSCSRQVIRDDSELGILWQIHESEINQIHDWDLRGRISLRIENDASSASLSWQQDDAGYHIRLTAPLGQGTFEIYGNDEEVFLRTDEDKLYQAKDPVSLMNETLGWHVPIEGLTYWIRGLPDTRLRIDNFELNNEGQLSELKQSGWHITYNRYAEIDEYTLPGRIQLDNGNLRIRIVTQTWGL